MYDQNQNRMARPAVMPQEYNGDIGMGQGYQPQMKQMQNQMRPAVMPQMKQMQNQMGGQQYQPQMKQMLNQMQPGNGPMPPNQNNPYAAFEGMTPDQLAGMGRIRDASPMDQARLQRIGTAMNSMNGFQGQMQNQMGRPQYQPQMKMGKPQYQPQVQQMQNQMQQAQLEPALRRYY